MGLKALFLGNKAYRAHKDRKKAFEKMEKMSLDKEKYGLLGYHYDFEKEVGKELWQEYLKVQAIFRNADMYSLKTLYQTLRYDRAE